jgi:hypothetical protein
VNVFEAFGLTIASNVPIPAFLQEVTDGGAAVELKLAPSEGVVCPPQAPPYFVSSWCDDQGNPVLRTWRTVSGFHLIYTGGPEFRINDSGTEIVGTYPASVGLDVAIGFYVLGPVLGFLLRLRGVLALHASGVVVDGKAVLFVGGCGAGKSTMAASFSQAGFPVLSDDIAPIHQTSDRFLVQPGYPRLKLCMESVQALFGRPDALPLIAEDWDKHSFTLSDSFAAKPAELAAIYLLYPSSEPYSTSVRDVPARDCLTDLVANTYANYLLDNDMRAAEFRALAAVVRNIPIRRLNRVSDFRQTPAVIDAIVADVRSLCTP